MELIVFTAIILCWIAEVVIVKNVLFSPMVRVTMSAAYAVVALLGGVYLFAATIATDFRYALPAMMCIAAGAFSIGLAVLSWYRFRNGDDGRRKRQCRTRFVPYYSRFF